MLDAAADRQTVNYEGCPENANGAWICADELQNGDKLLLANGNVVAIDCIRCESFAKAETTYNFEVSDSHTYYVSDSKVLMHIDDMAAMVAMGLSL